MATPDLTRADPDTDPAPGAAPFRPDTDGNASVAGEEDPGAALDLSSGLNLQPVGRPVALPAGPAPLPPIGR